MSPLRPRIRVVLPGVLLLLVTVTVCATLDSAIVPARQPRLASLPVPPAPATPTAGASPSPPAAEASVTPPARVTSTPTAAATATVTAVATNTPLPSPTATPSPSTTALPQRALLEPMNHQAQTINNCGPASVASVLGYYDIWVPQSDVQDWAATRPSPCYLPWYVAEMGLQAEVYRFPQNRGSRLDLIRALLAQGIPVIVLQQLEPGSDIRHYRVMQGYDDTAEEFISDDPLLGSDYRLSYDTFARLLNRAGALFMPVYPPEKEPAVARLVRELHARRWTDFDGLSCTQLEQD